MVREFLGLGSRTRVYRAERAGREVLLKVFDEADPGLADRLRGEIERLGRIRHPHLVGSYELVETADLVGVWHDFVPGRTLAEMLTGDPLPIEAVQIAGEQLIDAVAALHAAGVVHPDLVARNVRIGPGTLGLDALGDGAAPDERRGPAPEAELDALANVFSLGVLLYELACGAAPFGGLPDEVAAAMAQGRFRRPRQARPELPEAIDRAIAAALEPDRAHRVADAATLRALWVGEVAVWERPAGLPLLVDTPVPTTRSVPDATAPPEATPVPPVPAPIALATVVPAPIAPPATSPAPHPGRASAEAATPVSQSSRPSAAPVFVPPPPSNRGLWIGVVAAMVVCLALTGGLGVAAGLYLAEAPAPAVAPASLAGVTAAPAQVKAPAVVARTEVAAERPAITDEAPARATVASREPAEERAAPAPPAAPPPAEEAPGASVAAAPAPVEGVAAAAPAPEASAAEVAPDPAAAPPEAAPADPLAAGDAVAEAAPPPAPVVAAPAPAPAPAPPPAAPPVEEIAPVPTSGPRLVHWSDVQVKLMPRPDFPHTERDGAGATCLATVTINEKGLPVAVKVKNCPAPFAESTERAMMKARFAPPVIDGEKVQVITTLPVKFTPE